MVVRHTPYFSAKKFCETDLFKFLISITCLLVNFDRWDDSPFGTFVTCLPLFILSVMLSWCVPRNRWLGFTHFGLSQVWHTNESCASPKCIDQDNLCDDMTPCGLTIMLPYPPLDRAPDHSQQSSFPAIRVLDQNDLTCLSVSLNLFMVLFTFVRYSSGLELLDRLAGWKLRNERIRNLC